jgi:hypothetical protein
MQHLIIDVHRAFQAFVVIGDQGTTAYYNQIGDALFLAKTIIYFGQTLLGDGVIVSLCTNSETSLPTGKSYSRYGDAMLYIIISSLALWLRWLF